MNIRCSRCDAEYDDTYRWTFCPHNTFEMHTVVVRPGQPDAIARSVEELYVMLQEDGLEP